MLYETPQELLDMLEHDPAGLMRRFKEALEQVRIHGCQQPSFLQLPIQDSPPTFTQSMKGFEGEKFDPLKLGVACIVVPSPDGRIGRINSVDDYNWNPVPIPSPPSSVPAPRSRSESFSWKQIARE